MGRVETAVKLAVPQDAMPTLEGQAYKSSSAEITPGISWRVKAEFSIPGKVDLTAEQEFTISKPPAADVPSSRPVVAECTIYDAFSLFLSLQSADVCSWARLEGVFKVEMHEAVEVSRTVAKVARTETFGYKINFIEIDESVFTQHTVLQARQTYEWPVQFDIGEVKVPSTQTDNSKIKYTVTGELARKMRLDPSVSQEVNICI